MVRLRLTRIGRKNAPAYRIVAVHRNSKRDGDSLEIVGHYNPSENPVKLEIDKEKYAKWLGQGAQASTAVKKLLKGTYKYVPYSKGKIVTETEAVSE